MRKWLGICCILVTFALPTFGQQTGSISGKVTSADGEALPGVEVQATAAVLPQPRSATTSGTGDYRLPLLPPGQYELTFSMEGMGTQKRSVAVLLQQNTAVDAMLSVEAVTAEIQVVAQSTLIDAASPEIRSAFAAELIDSLPIGQEYRDLVKLIPGVQYSEDNVRGPSAGGSGQDNTYQFDGVNVTLPLFGTLSAEPSSHDIEQIAVVKGAANAVDFNRSGGFSINSVSKSGTNEFHGAVSYQVQPEGLTADRDTISTAIFNEDKEWLVANFGGPVLRDRLYFYTSYFRPTVTRESRSNSYGPVPDYESDRDEYFGKLSFAPTPSVSIHGSYRTSDREEKGASVLAGTTAGSASVGNEASLDIAIAEGSWIINQNSFASFKYTDFANETAGVPDNLFGFQVRLDGSVDLDIANLQRQGRLQVPVPLAGQTAFNNFIAPLINQHGFLQNGVRTGGGFVGGGSQIDDNDFFRESFQTSYDLLLGSSISHELHVGYQYTLDEEDLFRTSNGWGAITVPGGRTLFNGQPIFFQAAVQQQGVEGFSVPTIHSEYKAHNIEINDVIKWRNFAFNIGVLASNDQLFGQGLRPNSNNLSGFELSKTSKYKQYELDFEDTLQPRLGAVWAYDKASTVSVNYARYIPSASSLPRAASWARNLGATVNAFFDASGNFIGSTPEAASSGKFFQDNLDPRTTDEYALSTARSFGGGWTARANARYRYSYNFWEDTENDSRIRYNPPAGIERTLYIANLAQVRAEIGGSSYVIAELDGSFNKYYEAGLEAEWRGTNAQFRGSYTWSHYYGNFDQDSTTTALANDANIFIGSSNIADGAGRQLWDFKYGNLRGDRRHQLKMLGFYNFSWNGSAGAYAIYQSGQPWEEHNVEVYRSLTTSTSDTNRYAEPAGSNSTDAHYQIDLNYTQNFQFAGRYTAQVRADIFNILDNQTGYNVQALRNSANFGREQTFYDPRRIQLAVKFLF
jgi:Carboxypeptidase regulatory-like domain